MFTVYILENQKGKLYTGYTSNLELRLKEHYHGRVGSYTYKRGPWKLIYYEVYKTKDEASKREKFFKSGQGRSLIKQLIKI